MESLKIKVSMTKDDILAYHHDQHLNVTIWLGYIAILIFISFVPGYVKFLLMGIAALYFGRLEIGRYRGINKALELWNEVGEQTVAFTETGIRLVHSKGERQFDWSSITSFRDCKSAVIIYHLDCNAIYIPKRCLQPDELEKLNEYLADTADLTKKGERKRKILDRVLYIFVVLTIILTILVIMYGNDFTLWLYKIQNP